METEPLSNLMETSSKNCILLNVLFELTYKCNLDCCHCYTVKDKERREFSFEEIKDILDQLASVGTLYLTLSGGEVFTRTDFFEIAEYAKEKHFAITIFTNGTLITEEIAKKIVKLSPLNVGVSIYGVSSDTHEGVTGVKGSYQKSLRALQVLSERGVHTTLKCTLMKQNFEQYPQITKLAKSVGATVSFDPIVTPSSNGCKDNLKYRLVSKQLKKFFSDNTLYSAIRPKGLSYVTQDFSPDNLFCDAGRNFCSISPYGDVYPCVQLLIRTGNLRESSFSEIWDSEPLQKLRKLEIDDLPICSKCKMLSICNRCPGLALLEEGNLFGPSKVACTIAGAIAQKKLDF